MNQFDHITPPQGKSFMDRLPVLTLDRPLLQENHIVGFNNRALEARAFNLLRTNFAKKLKAEESSGDWHHIHRA